MTPTPHSIGAEQPLASAQTVMQRHAIRHLPVLQNGKLVGLLTDRDVHFLQLLRDVEPTLVTVSDAMAPIVYEVTPETPLDKVMVEMASRKCDAAVVMKNEKVVGIFTTVDICRALAGVLRFAKGP
jgi:acetoin utilization protein AcuB